MTRGKTEVNVGCAGCLAPFFIGFGVVLGGSAAWALAHAARVGWPSSCRHHQVCCVTYAAVGQAMHAVREGLRAPDQRPR